VNINCIFETVSKKISAAGIDVLLIGGFAVNHYGYTRNTLDVDFMIAAEDIGKVREVMLGAGFLNIEVMENVVFFQQPAGGLRVDFLKVDRETVRRLMKGAERATIGESVLQVPCLPDLIAMKLFAVAQGSKVRADKDIPDIVYLCLFNNLNLEKDVKPLCEKFAGLQVYEDICSRVRELGTP